MTEAEVNSLVDEQVRQISEPSVRAWLSKFVIPTRAQTGSYFTSFGRLEEFRLWIIADLQTQGVGIGFAEGGFGKIGRPWGLVLLNERDSGDSGNWYETLQTCILDSGWIDDPIAH